MSSGMEHLKFVLSMTVVGWRDVTYVDKPVTKPSFSELGPLLPLIVTSPLGRSMVHLGGNLAL